MVSCRQLFPPVLCGLYGWARTVGSPVQCNSFPSQRADPQFVSPLLPADFHSEATARPTLPPPSVPPLKEEEYETMDRLSGWEMNCTEPKKQQSLSISRALPQEGHVVISTKARVGDMFYWTTKNVKEIASIHGCTSAGSKNTPFTEAM